MVQATSIDRRFADHLDAGSLMLPVFPRVAQRVLEMSQDDKSGPVHIARMVEKDPVLCGRVLAAASSAFYGEANVVSVKQAVARLGTAEVAMLATAVALKGALLRSGPFEALLDECWRACVSTGMFAKEIARARRGGVETAFLCGLFHLVGRPIALGILVELGVECSDDVARDVAKRYEGPLGELAVADWGIGPAVVAAMASRDIAMPPPRVADDVHTVRLATALAEWAVDADPDTAGAIDTSPAAVALNLYPDDVAALRERAAAIMASLEALR